jgi:hypothetical protein
MLSFIVILASVVGTFYFIQYTEVNESPEASVDFNEQTVEVIHYESSDNVELVKEDETGNPTDSDKTIFIIADRYAYTTGTFSFGGTGYRISEVDRTGSGHTYYVRGEDVGDNIVPEDLPPNPGYTEVDVVYVTLTSLERADTVGVVYKDVTEAEFTEISDEAVIVGPNNEDQIFVYASYEGSQEYIQSYTYRT